MASKTTASKLRIATPSCAARFKVIGDPTRMAVIELLMERPWQVLELAGRLGIEQSRMSHHLKILRDAGLVQTTRVGKAVSYALAEGIVVQRPSRSIHLGCCDISFVAKK